MLAPFLKSLGFDSSVLYQFFFLICHQDPNNSFFLFGNPLGVCIRDVGVYLSFLLGTILYPFFVKDDKMPDKKWLIISAIPILVDGLTSLVGLRESNTFLRLLTGSLLGVVLPFYVIPGYLELVEKYLKRKGNN